MKNKKVDDDKKGRLADEWSEQLWRKLINEIAKTTDEKETQRILEKLVSESEKKMILKRLAVVALVQSGKSYREIGKILWLSPNTVSTIKKNIFDNHRYYKSYLDFYGGPIKWSSEITTSKTFLEKLFRDIDLWDLITNPPRPKGMGLKNK